MVEPFQNFLQLLKLVGYDLLSFAIQVRVYYHTCVNFTGCIGTIGFLIITKNEIVQVEKNHSYLPEKLNYLNVYV